MENINKPVLREQCQRGANVTWRHFIPFHVFTTPKKENVIYDHGRGEGWCGGSTLELHIVPRGKENILTSLNFCCFLLGFQAKEEACKQNVCVKREKYRDRQRQSVLLGNKTATNISFPPPSPIFILRESHCVPLCLFPS